MSNEQVAMKEKSLKFWFALFFLSSFFFCLLLYLTQGETYAAIFGKDWLSINK